MPLQAIQFGAYLVYRPQYPATTHNVLVELKLFQLGKGFIRFRDNQKLNALQCLERNSF